MRKRQRKKNLHKTYLGQHKCTCNMLDAQLLGIIYSIMDYNIYGYVKFDGSTHSAAYWLKTKGL